MRCVELANVRVILIGMFLFFFMLSSDALGQRKSRHTKAFYRSHYRPAPKADKQCFLLFKKKYKKPNKKGNGSFLSFIFGKPKPESKPMAEVDPNDTPPKAKPQPIAQKKPVEDFHKKSFEEQTIEERRMMEDEVFEKNNLPKPTSAKHEEVRRKVEQQLKGHKNGEPIQLDPLYFIYDDAEFAVVDMEPFLIAVEYALQGRMILIEGHTDSQGSEEYNVKLSIDRVEKIRKLMHDMGVPDDHISVVGYGEEVSEHDNDTEEGREKNRRVDFKVF